MKRLLILTVILSICCTGCLKASDLKFDTPMVNTIDGTNNTSNHNTLEYMNDYRNIADSIISHIPYATPYVTQEDEITINSEDSSSSSSNYNSSDIEDYVNPSTEVYDFVTGTWSTLPTPTPAPTETTTESAGYPMNPYDPGNSGPSVEVNYTEVVPQESANPTQIPNTVTPIPTVKPEDVIAVVEKGYTRFDYSKATKYLEALGYIVEKTENSLIANNYDLNVSFQIIEYFNAYSALELVYSSDVLGTQSKTHAKEGYYTNRGDFTISQVSDGITVGYIETSMIGRYKNIVFMVRCADYREPDIYLMFKEMGLFKDVDSKAVHSFNDAGTDAKAKELTGSYSTYLLKLKEAKMDLEYVNFEQLTADKAFKVSPLIDDIKAFISDLLEISDEETEDLITETKSELALLNQKDFWKTYPQTSKVKTLNEIKDLLSKSGSAPELFSTSLTCQINGSEITIILTQLTNKGAKDTFEIEKQYSGYIHGSDDQVITDYGEIVTSTNNMNFYITGYKNDVFIQISSSYTDRIQAIKCLYMLGLFFPEKDIY